MAGIFVHVIDGLTPARLSTGAIRASGQPIEPRIQDPGLVRQSALSSGRLPGMVTTNIGDAIYLNLDGALDVWGSLPISGKKLTCYYGDDGGVFPDDFEVDFIAYIEGAPRFSRDADGSHIATISLRDRSYLFATAAVSRGFLQTGGMEGTEVAGARRRQRVYGLPGYPEPILISPFEGGLNAYYLGHQEESGALILYDGGVALAEASPYATEADFLDAGDAPGPGEWRRWFDADEGLFGRFGSKVYVGLRFAADFPEDSISDIALAAGVTGAASMAAGSVDLDIGNRVVETQTAGAVLSDVARQHLSVIGFNRADEFMQRTIEPSTVASYETDVVLVDGENVLSIDGVGPPQGFERRAWKVKVRSGATKAGQLAGIPDLSFGAAEAVVRERWIAEFSGISQATKDDDDSAEVMEVEVEANAFAGDSAAMLAYVEAVLALFGGIQIWFDIVVPYGDASIRALQLLDRVMIRAEGGRYMTGTGRWARVVSIERRLAQEEIRLSLWAHYTEPDDVELIEVDDAYAATSYSSKALRDQTRRPDPYVVACSAVGANITAGLLQVIDPWPVDYRLADVEIGLSQAQPSGSIFRVDVKVDTVSIFSTKPTIDNTETTSLTAATPPVLSAYEIPQGSRVEFYADQVGAAGAQGLKVNLVGFQ